MDELKQLAQLIFEKMSGEEEIGILGIHSNKNINQKIFVNWDSLQTNAKEK